MRVLVTGGSGRLGRNVVGALAAAGDEVVSVDTVPEERDDDVATFPADLTDAGECYSTLARFRPDAVVHLAAIPAPGMRSDVRTFTTNTSLAYNVCQSAADLGVGHVLVASSPTVMGYGNPAGWQPSYLPLDEDHPVAPWNAYTMSKVATEDVVRAFARRGEGRFHIFRPCFVVSPEEWRGAPTQGGGTVRQRLENRTRAAVSLFNYVDARDAAEFVRLLLAKAEHVPNGETFFVAAADALAEKPLSELLPEYMAVPEKIAGQLAGTASAFDTSKARRLLGWAPRYDWRTELV
ncbi:nucleoside-diphosphate-sugar epimerase [Prauserella isguenensis]|uniref:Nucleoside-diphosphate-sugar epimerase n=1 Tax=Prauserella isguenensis TaxID=1470180 RepID=A0A839S7Z1_9PSEU|nr:NAD(P)-dependent oxidoreductase [Prauserella isguenensis]MBB3053502.1 nucleoside-diphosphate-sugar epimerase [Prauserella isguenensis]